MQCLKEKVVIVTGSGAGLGEATALLFAKLGSRLVINDLNEEDAVKVAEKCEELSPEKCKALTVVGDITIETTREALINKTMATFGKLDILVNNAGISIFENVLSEKFPDALDKVMDTNLRSPLMLTRLAMPFLIESKGCVINISSIGSFRVGMPDNLPYLMSKSALDSMTRVLANEFGPQGVRVVSINPGFVKTTILAKHKMPNEVYDEYAKDFPLRRAADAEEVANVICFMASNLASYVTGTSIIVDGGHCTE